MQPSANIINDSDVLLSEQHLDSGNEREFAKRKAESIAKGMQSAISENPDEPLHDIVFPTDVFPPLFRKVITDASRCLNYPPDYTGSAMLAALATAVGKTARMKVKTGWYEFASLWVGIIGPPGASKTHALRLAFEPFEEIDRTAIKEFEAKQLKYDAYESLSKKEKQGEEPVSRPVLKKNVLHNFTPEILLQRLADNDIGCAVVADELATYLEGMNNYSKGDQSSAHISIWSNAATSIDRVGRTVPLWLPQPYLTIVGCLQPRVLPQTFPAGRTNNGFAQRYLFSWADRSGKQPINDNELEEQTIRDYSQWITNYREQHPPVIDESGKSLPKIYHWSEPAKVYFYNWHRELTEKTKEAGDTIKGEILSKFDIHFCRLALLLQIMENEHQGLISERAAIGAARLCEYFQVTAFKVLEHLGQSEPLTGLPQNKQNFYKALQKGFTTAEANNIGEQHGFNIKAVQRFLLQSGLFMQVKTGHYTKK